ncbi:hypothetical protein ACIP4Y_07300 [Streptomyces sp. NPDC088810]|uniref:hypothetical protein n=1 Tax=Streptomyces sp. NPDC088810 TaxID=3365904 RepID=UPI00382E4D17
MSEGVSEGHSPSARRLMPAVAGGSRPVLTRPASHPEAGGAGRRRADGPAEEDV